MKNILLIIFIVINLSSFSQTIKFEKIVKTDSVISKETLFNRLNSRLIEYIGGQSKYNKKIIQSDKNLGVIKFKQKIEYNPKGNRSDDGFVNYNVNVYFRKGRFKIILTDFTHIGKGISLYEITTDKEYPHKKSNYLKFRKRGWIQIKEFLNIEIPKNILILKKLILTKTEQEKEW